MFLLVTSPALAPPIVAPWHTSEIAGRCKPSMQMRSADERRNARHAFGPSDGGGYGMPGGGETDMMRYPMQQRQRSSGPQARYVRSRPSLLHTCVHAHI